MSAESLRAWVDEALLGGVPLGAYVHGIGTDVEHDLANLWKLTVAARPRIVLELGTRRAVSTRTLAHACQRAGAVLFTCDPDPSCAPFLRGVPAVACRTTGERLFELGLFPPGSVDVLFVDTDPHSHAQTMGHLDTWVTSILAPGGVALFHDVNARDVSGAARPDIQVKEAIADWVRGKHGSAFGAQAIAAHDPGVQWDYVELGHDGAGGLGVLRRRGC